MFKFLKFVTEPRHSGYFFATALFVVYGLAPITIYSLFDRNPYMLQIGLMCSLAAVVVAGAFRITWFDPLIGDHRFRIPIPHTLFQISVWGAFIIFFAVAMATAEAVPVISALFGEFTAEQLDAQRGAFLKTRDGWAASLGYIGGTFSGLLLPLAMAMLFVRRSPARFPALALFVVYSISYLQKALFIQVAAPLFYLTARRVIWNYLGLVALLVGSVALLYLNTYLSRGVVDEAKTQVILEQREDRRQELKAARSEQLSEENRATGDQSSTPEAPVETSIAAPQADIFPPDFFQSTFLPANTAEHLAWRAFAVPIFTAADALRVLDKEFHGAHLYGATSSAISAVLGLKRINYDAEVYGYQWGKTEVGRANSVFVTDGYVNFGWFGVVAFATIVGLGFRAIWLSGDEAIRAMWPLFAYNVIQASLIGTLLSSGFVLLFGIIFFTKIEGASPARKQTV